MANPLDRFSGKRGSVDVKIRPMPKVADFYRRGGSPDWASQFDAAMETWRQDLQRIFPSDQSITESVTNIIQTVVQASSGGVSEVPTEPAVDISALTAQVNAIASDLAAHIAANIVHGTMSPVVGEDDEQSLTRKTIGESQHRNGKFKHSIQQSEVDSTDSYTIPTGFNMVVAGPFDIDGELIVDGALAVV
ncbi:MAG TPA: hypothetical protein VFU31_19265 [Candidatus Binatia bacterium]|nr:hypothetical protein [Candidatus Binatia bacterium]